MNVDRDLYYARQNPDSYDPITVVVDGVKVTERPPTWFRNAQEQALARDLRPRKQHRGKRSRPAARRSSKRSTRGSPDDSGEPEPAEGFPDVDNFAGESLPPSPTERGGSEEVHATGLEAPPAVRPERSAGARPSGGAP